MDMRTAYEITAYIPQADAVIEGWTEDAADHRAVEASIGRAMLNLPYGDHPRARYDLFLPAGRPEGLVVFVHGGYWRRFDRSDFSHFSRGAVARGWAVAMPSYPLVPEVRISEITQHVARAIATAAARVPAGPMILAGHSAGGHLVARMAEANGPLSAVLQDRVQRVVPISPLGDLRPLLQTPLNADLHLDAVEAEAESPILRRPAPGLAVTIWAAEHERPVFLQQAEDLARAWGGGHRIAPGCHHLDVIHGLAEPDSPLTESLFTG
ncbi:alpha/beta hydrolase [Fluviibacterium sp. DFM31]|uniref:Alpha/beta hydrolase n=1 Tax=Meridianimarinicoccus marinus TaxID=3231483 RepID=A0ABV3L2X2_9RHOB